LGTGNCYKVGHTKNDPEERKRGFASGSPVKATHYRSIQTEYPSDLEKYIHQLLDERRAENGEIFNVTAQELDDAVDRALAFVEKFQPLRREAEKLRRNPPSNTMVESSSEMFEIYRKIRSLKREEYLIGQEIDFLESKIQIAIGDNCGMRGVASWKWADNWRMDIERFKKEQSELYERYIHNSGSRRFLLERVDLSRIISLSA
jgi:hypothetical protein